eukprot:jgi/Picre1/27454/NNA_000421.t1
MKERLAAQGNGESKEKMNDEKGASVQEEKGHDEAVEVKKDSKSSTPVSATGTNNSERSGKNNADMGLLLRGRRLKAPKRKAAIGYKVKVFWPGMAKWYVGKVLDYDTDSKKHTVKYKDGDVQQISLRHEAVLYLGKDEEGKDPSGAVGKKSASAKKEVTSGDKMEIMWLRRSEALHDTMLGRMGEFGTSEFRYLTPRTRSTGCSKEFLKAMENLRAEQYKTFEEIENDSGMKGSVKPVETISRRAPVKEACVSWRLSIRGADKKWYLGQVISYQRDSDLHLVLYDDGEHERLHLPSELIAWHCLAKDRKTPVFPGKHKSVDVPVGTKAIGWRIAVYWPIEDEFFHGEIVAFDPEEETYEVNYDDGDETIITLADDKVKWLFSPGVK